MWHLNIEESLPTQGTYRAVFRYDYPECYAPEDPVLQRRVNESKRFFKNPPLGSEEFSQLRTTSRTASVILQKKLKDELTGLTAWCVLSTGHSFQSYKDQFNKRIGRRLAYQRAVKSLPLTDSGYEYKEVFEQLWNAHSTKDELYPEEEAAPRC